MDSNTVVALVHAWLLEHPEHYCSWVQPHTQLRFNKEQKKLMATHVAGHYRAMALWRNVLPSLRATCKFEVLVKPKLLEPPPSVRMKEVPMRQYRLLVWA